jgi:hypothetical protein
MGPVALRVQLPLHLPRGETVQGYAPVGTRESTILVAG